MLKGLATRRLLLVGGLALAVVFMVRAASNSLFGPEGVGSLGFFDQAAVVTIVIGSTLILGLLWHRILRQLGVALAVGPVLSFFLTSWPYRYIPGTLPYHATRVLMADSFGARKSTVVVSIGYESVLMISASGFVGVLGMLLGVGAEYSAFALIPVVGLVILIQPRVLVPMVNKLQKLTGRGAPISTEETLSARNTLALFLGYALVNCLTGLAFWIVCGSISNAEINPLVAIGAFSLAGAAGVAVVFVPSGIGVREAIIAALLTGVVPHEHALLAGATVRALSVVADLAPLLLLTTYKGVTSVFWRGSRADGMRILSDEEQRKAA
jgi:hypothetical protein